MGVGADEQTKSIHIMKSRSYLPKREPAVLKLLQLQSLAKVPDGKHAVESNVVRIEM